MAVPPGATAFARAPAGRAGPPADDLDVTIRAAMFDAALRAAGRPVRTAPTPSTNSCAAGGRSPWTRRSPDT
ncbi:hypothetical protein [Streptomyces sp. NPDC000931]|uniref:hypothetical protein n=1 Tax=Streptomyces sp. NPDC000931 TaxID=3154372 RepID=UPI003328CA26